MNSKVNGSPVTRTAREIEKTKTRLKYIALRSYIKLHIKSHAAVPDFNTGDYNALEQKDLIRPLKIRIPVDNSYLDVEDECGETRTVNTILVDRSGITVITDEGDEIQDKDLTIEELADIVSVIELSAKNKKTK